MSLFARRSPLADRMRPNCLEHFAGQEHLLAEGALLRRLIDRDKVSSIILFGAPSTGKTTLARIIAQRSRALFVEFSAVTNSASELRKIVDDSIRHFEVGRATFLFVDEIHRMRRDTQEICLHGLEAGHFTLIGATTENPSCSLVAGLLSRSSVFRLKPLSTENIEQILTKAVTSTEGVAGEIAGIDAAAIHYLASRCRGEARTALNLLESISSAYAGERITMEIVREAADTQPLLYDAGDRFALLSALQKSVRNSDPDAAIYYLAALLEAGEDPVGIARRLTVMASEECGNATPAALSVAASGLVAAQTIGMPECRINLAQVATYLASSPKSNAAYKALNEATEVIRTAGRATVPDHLRNVKSDFDKSLGIGDGYLYAHNYAEGVAPMNCLPDDQQGVRFYRPKKSGFEVQVARYLDFVAEAKKKSTPESRRPVCYSDWERGRIRQTASDIRDEEGSS